MQEAWEQLKKHEDEFWKQVIATEAWLFNETGIKDIEFIKDEMCGGEWVGIGNSSRTMRLYQREELERGNNA